MIHLDTYGISFIAKDPRLREAFAAYLARSKESLLLNTSQLIELMKSSRSGFKVLLADFLDSVPRKRLLPLVIVEVVYQEIAHVYEYGRILSPQEFENFYTLEIPASESLHELLNGAETAWIQTKDMQNAWVGGALFGKMVSTKKVPGAGKLRVRDYLERLAPNASCSPFEKRGALAEFDKHAPKPGDIIAYSEYAHLINRVDRSKGQELLQWIKDSIEQFHFPSTVLDWKARKFLEQDYFLRIARLAREKMHDPKDPPEKFYGRLSAMDLREFPSFFMVHRVSEFLKKRPQKQKASDFFDVLFIALLPYMSVFLCDREIHSAINQVAKSNRMRWSFNNCIWSEFMRKLEGK